jgi:hypothetical protein
MEYILTGIRKRYHERSVEVDNALFEKAKKGDPKAAELWYRKMEAWNIQHGGGDQKIIIIIPPVVLPKDQRQAGERVIEMKSVGEQEIEGEQEEVPSTYESGQEWRKLIEDKEGEKY